jgi:dipeptidyl aminopeptidase/acylaminoacyl peptidase
VGRYAEASPLTYVTADDPPFMIIHGTADTTVPHEQLGIMTRALGDVRVEVRAISVDDGSHGPELDLGAITQWMNTHLVR